MALGNFAVKSVVQHNGKYKVFLANQNANFLHTYLFLASVCSSSSKVAIVNLTPAIYFTELSHFVTKD